MQKRLERSQALEPIKLHRPRDSRFDVHVALRWMWAFVQSVAQRSDLLLYLVQIVRMVRSVSHSQILQYHVRRSVET